jgi:hypothetical protein
MHADLGIKGKRKIDAAVAFIMAIARVMVTADHPGPSVYAGRRLLTLG